MTGAMRDALELIRSLKEQYPDETEDQLISRFHKELEADQALRRALMRDVFKNLLQELGEGKPPSSKVHERRGKPTTSARQPSAARHSPRLVSSPSQYVRSGAL